MDIQRAGGDGGSTLPGAVPYVRILRACPLDADRIFLSAAGAVLAALLFSRDKRRFIWKCAGSLCLFAALFILALKLGWWGDVFAVFNAQYAAEYGGMNMGDAAGIFLLWTPTAFAALIGGVIVSAGVRRSVIEKENLRASAGGLLEGTDDTGT